MNQTIKMRPDFKEKLASFVAGCERICTGYGNEVTWGVTWLKRYVRVETSRSEGGSCFCFVDIETGEVLKSGGWKAPAITKTRRGNIFDEHNGLKHLGPYGVADASGIKQIETIS